MVSLRFPFTFSNPKPPRPFSKFAAAAAATAGATAAFIAVSSNDRHRLFLQNALNSFLTSNNNSLPLWGSLSLADSGVPIVDSRTGSSFPSVLEASQKLCGIGLRTKRILGLKNIDVYAFGMLLYFTFILQLIILPIYLFYLIILRRFCMVKTSDS